jgi:diguanylate cyclase (GGDEF)-like protein/PAS domain S-box-containing protein
MDSPNIPGNLFPRLVEQISEATVVFDEYGTILVFNAAAERLWKMDRTTVLGTDIDQLVPATTPENHPDRADDDATPTTGVRHLAGRTVELPLANPDGGQIWIELSVARLDIDGREMHALTAHDISMRHVEDRIMQLGMPGLHETSAILVTDTCHRILRVSTGFTRMFGWNQEEIAGRHPRELLFSYPHPRPEDEFTDVHAQLAAGQPVQTEELAHDRHGHPLWCSVTVTPTTDGNDGFFAVAILTDITHSMVYDVLQSRVLKAMVEEEPLAEVMNLLCHEIQRITPDVAATVAQLDGSDRLHLLASPDFPPEYTKNINGTTIGPDAGSCAAAAYRGNPVLATDIEHDPCWNETRQHILPLGYKACWSNPFKTHDGRVLGTLAFYFRDNRAPNRLHEQLAEVCTQLCALALKRSENRAHIHRLAFFDDLTGLPNRSLLRAQADQAIAQATRNGERLAVLFIDLDRFKQVNDSLGHPAGDALLRVVTERLRETLRGTDIIGRQSGDEFVVILTQCDSKRATNLADRLLTVLSAPCRIGELTLSPAASIGISLFPDNGRDMDTLLHHADTAMYQAKHKGRGRFSFFSSEMNRIARERLALEAALRDTLADQRLELYYQPQVDIENNRLHGVEALVRWHHPRLGQIPPPRFIPLAEECGLIGQLSFWALREACRQLAQWRQNGLSIPTVSVNLSPTDFHNLELPNHLDFILRKNSLSPSDLVIEITEGVVMDANPSTLKTLNEIHALGVRLSIDDFGIGYSSLGYLRHLPVSELKLDQSFVHDLGHDRATRSLTNAVIHIGDSMELTVIAEGVEDPMQRNLLKAQGYQIVQGYLYSQPLSAQGLEHWVDINMSFTQWV